MKFQPNFSSVHIPLTQTCIVFSSQALIMENICKTLNLLALRYNTADNVVDIPLVGLKVEINRFGSVSFVSFNLSERSKRAKYIISVIAKLLCTIQK